jgi:hypothetical protein
MANVNMYRGSIGSGQGLRKMCGRAMIDRK